MEQKDLEDEKKEKMIQYYRAINGEATTLQIEPFKWYNTTNNPRMLMYIMEVKGFDGVYFLKGFGFTQKGFHKSLISNCMFWHHFYLATEDDVKEALTNEAINHGYEKDSNFIFSKSVKGDLFIYLKRKKIFSNGFWVEKETD